MGEANMRWKRPEPGYSRRKVRFAFLPVYCTNGYIVWLERYQIVQKYDCSYSRWRTFSILPLECTDNSVDTDWS